MIKKLSSLLIAVVISSALFLTMFPTPVSATCPTRGFLTFRPWYYGLNCDGQNNVQAPAQTEEAWQNYIFTIAFNILFNLIQVVAYVTLVFVIMGGYHYVMSRGDPSGVAKGKKTILNAVIGLVISVLASAIVNTVQSIVGTPAEHRTEGAETAVLGNALGFIYFAIGLIAVIVISYAGFTYVTSAGSPEKLTKAKQTIIYAIIGLVVAIGAWAITAFVLESVGG